MAGPIKISILADANPAVKAVKGFASSLKSTMAFAGAALAGAGIVEGFKTVVTAASDMNETVSKTGQVFGKQTGAILAWSSNAAKGLGLSKQAALDGASAFGNFLNQVGFSQKAAASMSKGFVQMSSDFASFYNADPAAVMDAFQSATRGEYDALQKFLPKINAAAVQAEAMKETGKKNAKALTDQEKAQALYTLAVQGQGKAQGDFARTSGGAANQMRILKATMMDWAATIGAVVLPAVTAAAQWINGTLLPALQDLWAKHGPQVTAAFAAIGAAVSTGFGAVKAAIPVVVAAVQGLITSFSSGTASGSGFSGVMSRIGVFAGIAFKALQVIAPYVQGALVVAFNVLQAVVVTAMDAFNGLFNFVSSNQTTLTVIAGVITGILTPALVTMGVQAVAAWTKAGVAAAQNAVVMIANGIRAAAVWTLMGVGATVNAAKTVAGWVAQGAAATVNAAKVAAGWVVASAGAVANGAIMAAQFARIVAGWVLMGVQSLIQAARMAAAWLIAMGPVGLVIAAVIALVALIIANWDKIVAATVAAWNWVKSVTMAVWNGIKALFMAYVTFYVTIITTAWNAIKSATSSVWNGIKSVISSVVGAIRGAIANAVNGAKAVWAGITFLYTKAQSVVSSLIGVVAGIAGKVRGALSGAVSWLVGVGRDIVQGMINGVSGMVGSLMGKVRDLASSAINSAKSALGIHSPSKVFAALGRWVGLGFIQGLVGTEKSIISNVKSLGNKIAAAFPDVTEMVGKGKKRHKVTIINKTQSRLVKMVQAQGTKLASYANQRDAIAKRISDANASIVDMQKSRADVMNNIADTIRQSFALVETGVVVTMGSIIARIKDANTAATRFNGDLATLAKRGLDPRMIQELAAAGPDAARSTIAALLSGTTGDIKTINDQYKALQAMAVKTGDTVGGALYDAGIKAAQGLVTGLLKQKSSIEKTMLDIAKAMQSAIKKALGIHSPSRKMKVLGEQTIQGFANGFNSISGKSMVRDLGKGLTSSTPALSGAVAAGGASADLTGMGTTVINVTLNVPPTANPAATGRELIKVIQAYEKTYSRTYLTTQVSP